MSSPKLVTPGEKLGESDHFQPGNGVYIHKSHLIATIVGSLHRDNSTAKPTLSVASLDPPPLPKLGSTVTARIVKVTPRAAHVEILVIDGRPLRDMFKGLIRQQDVRQMEVEKVEIYQCFQPNDVIKAEIISLGDRHSYFLSTAKNELGVVYAKSRVGVPMIPVNWQEMQCPVSKTKEFRKVAKQ